MNVTCLTINRLIDNLVEAKDDRPSLVANLVKSLDEFRFILANTNIPSSVTRWVTQARNMLHRGEVTSLEAIKALYGLLNRIADTLHKIDETDPIDDSIKQVWLDVGHDFQALATHISSGPSSNLAKVHQHRMNIVMEQVLKYVRALQDLLPPGTIRDKVSSIIQTITDKQSKETFEDFINRFLDLNSVMRDQQRPELQRAWLDILPHIVMLKELVKNRPEPPRPENPDELSFSESANRLIYSLVEADDEEPIDPGAEAENKKKKQAGLNQIVDVIVNHLQFIRDVMQHEPETFSTQIVKLVSNLESAFRLQKHADILKVAKALDASINRINHPGIMGVWASHNGTWELIRIYTLALSKTPGILDNPDELSFSESNRLLGLPQSRH